MAAATASPTYLHDPWAQHHNHYSPVDTVALLDLLSVDNLIDSHAPPPKEQTLLQDLWAVDLQIRRAEIRDEENVATAPKLKDEKYLILDLLATDQEVDGAKHSKENSPEQHFSTTKALHDPYVPKEQFLISLFTGIYAANNDGARWSSGEELLRDNKTMMHLLAVDQSFDDRKRWTKDVESEEYAIIGELFDVDKEISGAKRKALLVEDLQGLLDVDRLVDGKKRGSGGGLIRNGQGNVGGKRSIFSAKEKYAAKVADKYAR